MKYVIKHSSPKMISVFAILLIMAANGKADLVFEHSSGAEYHISDNGDFHFIPGIDRSTTASPTSGSLSFEKGTQTPMWFTTEKAYLKEELAENTLAFPDEDLQIAKTEDGTPVTKAEISEIGRLWLAGIGPRKTTYYVLGVSGAELATYNEFGQKEYVNLYAQGLVGREEGTGTAQEKQYFYLKDHLGSTRMVVTENSAANGVDIVDAIDYHPYGKAVRTTQEVTDTRQTFTGKEYDREGATQYARTGIGAYYFGARYYDPEVVAWLSMDKAGQFNSPYLYSSNPIIFVDADGNWFGADDATAAIIGFLGGAVVYAFTHEGNFDFGRMLAYGAIGAGAAWLTLNTGGAAAAKATSFWGAVGHGAAGGAVGGAFTGAATYTERAAYGGSGYSTSNLRNNWVIGDFAASTAIGAGTGALAGGATAGIGYGIKRGAASVYEKAMEEADLVNPENKVAGVFDDANTAMKRFARSEGVTDVDLGLPKIFENNRYDAFRHQYAGGTLKAKYGDFVSNFMGKSYEWYAGGSSASRVMDLANNYIGRTSIVANQTQDMIYSKISSNITEGMWVNIRGLLVKTGQQFVY